MQSPFQAWPAEHLHHSAEGVTASSPLPGLGPRLVVSLARHRAAGAATARRRRYGPAAVLRDMLEDGPAAALQAVLDPAPLPVLCGDEWHSVGRARGRLVLHDHHDLDVDAELVAAALTWTRTSGCLHRAQLWNRRGGDVVPPGLGMLPVLEAARRWHAQGESLVDHDPWIVQAWGPADVQHATSVGIDPVEMLRWLPVTRVPEVARGWRDAGWTVGEAVELAPFMAPGESARWRCAGFDVNRIREARRTRLALQEASAWHAADWPLLSAGVLASHGCALPEANALLAVTGRRAQVIALARVGITTAALLDQELASRELAVADLLAELAERR